VDIGSSESSVLLLKSLNDEFLKTHRSCHSSVNRLVSKWIARLLASYSSSELGVSLQIPWANHISLLKSDHFVKALTPAQCYIGSGMEM